MTVETNEWVDVDHAQQFLDKRAQLPQLDVAYSEQTSNASGNGGNWHCSPARNLRCNAFPTG